MNSKWPIEKIGLHIKQFSEKNKSNELLDVFSVTNSQGFVKSTDYFSKKVYSKDTQNYKIVNKNYFAYNPSRVNVGSIDFQRKQDKVLVSPLYTVFRTDDLLDNNYLLYFLKSHWGNQQIQSRSEGAVRKNLKYKGLENIKIPIPSVNDQIRIARLLSRIEALINTRKENLKLLDEFLKSTFLEMFGDPVRNEKEWKKEAINSFSKVRIGPFGSLLHAEDYISDGIPLINPSHIINGKIIPNSKLCLTEEKYQELSKYHLTKDDVVVARRGEIGRCAIVENNQKLFCGTGSMFIRISNDYSPLFLQFQIFNTTLRNYLESKAKGVTMKNLNSIILGNLEVLVPPDKLVNKFVQIVEKVKFISYEYQKNLTDLENLYGAVSQKAFKGELDLSAIPVVAT